MFITFLIAVLCVLNGECNGARFSYLTDKMPSAGGTNIARKLSAARTKGDGTFTEPIDLGVDGNVEVVETADTANEGRRVKILQTYKGVKIYGATGSIVVDQNGVPEGTRNTGYLIVDLSADLQSMEAEVSRESAINIAKDLADCKDNANNGAVRTECEQYICIRTVNNDKKRDTNKAVLCWVVTLLCSNLTNNGSVSRPNAVIDAGSGEVLEYWNSLTKIDIQAVGGKISQVEHYTIDVYQDPAYYPESVCFYKNQMVELMDVLRKAPYSITRFTVRGFPCDAANDETGFDRTHDTVSPMNDAYLHADITSRMFLELVGRVPHSRHGQSQVVKVMAHANGCSDSAYWDGESVVFGDGCHRFYPMVSLDLVAHEIAHGFTEFTSGLQYSGESGGLNEAFSDIAGEAAEYFYQGFNDWRVADGIPKNGRPIRFMDEPTSDGVSIDHLSSYNPWGHTVHQSSGLFNKAFYLLSTKPDWDPLKAFQVYAMANMMLWNTQETFQCAGCKLVIAAEDLAFDTSAVKDSLSFVGIKTCSSCCRMC